MREHEAMPLPRARVLTRPPHINGIDWGSRDRFAIADTLERLAALDIKPPAKVAATFKKAVELRSQARAVGLADDRAAHSVSALGRPVTQGEADAAAILRQAQQTYADAASALAAGAMQIIEELRARLPDVLAAALTSTSDHDHELEARYEGIHDLAKRLRWATGDIEGVGSVDWWRFENPRGPWAWRMTEAARIAASRSPQRRLVHRHSHGRGRLEDGTSVHFVQATGVTLSLRVIAEHADEWRPTIVTAAQLLEHADEAAREIMLMPAGAARAPAPTPRGGVW